MAASVLPKLTVAHTYKHPDTGKRKKREIVSPDAFSDFIQLGVALGTIRDNIVIRLDLQDADEENDLPALSEAEITEAPEGWPTELPGDPILQQVLGMFTAFMQHLELYKDLLNTAVETEDVPWVMDRYTEMQDRIGYIEEILDPWQSKDKKRFAELLVDEEFMSNLEFDIPE
jgi:hypothetical protein